jgi:hypothetical protein
MEQKWVESIKHVQIGVIFTTNFFFLERVGELCIIILRRMKGVQNRPLQTAQRAANTKLITHPSL